MHPAIVHYGLAKIVQAARQCSRRPTTINPNTSRTDPPRPKGHPNPPGSTSHTRTLEARKRRHQKQVSRDPNRKPARSATLGRFQKCVIIGHTFRSALTYA